MDALILLVLLTMKDGGPLQVNFVEFPDVPSCEARAEELTGILVKGGYKVVESPCVMGIQHFTPHRHRRTKGDHGKQAPAERKRVYLLALDNQRVLALPKRSMEDCEKMRRHEESRIDKAAAARGVRYYCAVSEQVLIDDRDYEAMKRRAKRKAWEERQKNRQKD